MVSVEFSLIDKVLKKEISKSCFGCDWTVNLTAAVWNTIKERLAVRLTRF